METVTITMKMAAALYLEADNVFLMHLPVLVYSIAELCSTRAT